MILLGVYWLGGAVFSTVTSEQEGSLKEFACSLHVCVDSLRVPFHPRTKDMHFIG